MGGNGCKIGGRRIVSGEREPIKAEALINKMVEGDILIVLGNIVPIGGGMGVEVGDRHKCEEIRSVRVSIDKEDLNMWESTCRVEIEGKKI